MVSINVVFLSFFIGVASSLSATHLFANRQKVRRRYLYYIERLKLPSPFHQEPAGERFLFWLPVLTAPFILILLITLAAPPRSDFFELSSLHYIGKYFQSTSIQIGMTSPSLWVLGLLVGLLITYSNYFVSWRILNLLPERKRTFQSWSITRILLFLTILISFFSVLGIFLFGTGFWNNLGTGFGILGVALFMCWYGDQKSEK